LTITGRGGPAGIEARELVATVSEMEAALRSATVQRVAALGMSGALALSTAISAQPPPPRLAPTASVAFLPAEAAARCQPVLVAPSAAALRAKAVSLLDSRGVRRPASWADAAATALCAAGLPLDAAHLALTFAFIERESGFDAHSVLPNQPEGFRKLGYRLIDDVLAGESGDADRLLGKELAGRVLAATISGFKKVGLLDQASLRKVFDHYYDRFGWRHVRTEWALENIVARDVLTIADESSATGLALRAILAWVPQWREWLGSGAILQSVGPMQVGPATAVRLAAEDGVSLTEAQARALLYTIDAGVYYGVRQFRYVVSINTAGRPLTAAASGIIAADRRLGPFACRDAAVVQQIGQLAGRSLPLGTPLRSDEVRALLLALERELGAAEGPVPARASDAAAAYPESANRFLSLAGQPSLERSPLYQRIRAAYRLRFNRMPSFAVVPEMRYYSAKTGRYRLSEIVDDTRRRFASNCVHLGCST
jgi:hypothetical protein